MMQVFATFGLLILFEKLRARDHLAKATASPIVLARVIDLLGLKASLTRVIVFVAASGHRTRPDVVLSRTCRKRSAR